MKYLTLEWLLKFWLFKFILIFVAEISQKCFEFLSFTFIKCDAFWQFSFLNFWNLWILKCNIILKIWFLTSLSCFLTRFHDLKFVNFCVKVLEGLDFLNMSTFLIRPGAISRNILNFLYFQFKQLQDQFKSQISWKTLKIWINKSQMLEINQKYLLIKIKARAVYIF